MGRFADKAREIKKQNEGKFQPLELSEGNVQAIFNRCLATDSTTEHIKSILQQKEYGLPQDSEGILFDREKILANIQAVKYLYGQLFTTHEKSNTINISTKTKSNSMTNYLGNNWTMNKGMILQFFHLGVASNIIYPFSSELHSIFKKVVNPTLSPKDPNFPAWWEEHKGEWVE